MILKYLKRIGSFIGPYPYNPTFIFLFFFAFYFSRFIPVVTEQPKGLYRWEAGGLVILTACLPSLIFSMCAYLLQRYRFWNKTNLLYYMLEVTACHSFPIFLNPVMQKIMNVRSVERIQTPITNSINIYLASLTLTFIGLGLMHKAERSISNRFMDAEELVKRLESDRQELVNSDEELRRQTSQFLHDRVQSDLMVIGMKLKSISGKSSPEVEDVLDKAAQRLEKIRTSDIRNLVQILSPNFEAGGLDEALEQLKDQYLKIMDVTIHIEIEPAELDSKELLGIYRIVEQALLNSLIHGPAEKVIVEIEHKNEKEISLVISDNGPGIKAHPIIFGVGSAVIDSWVSILNGRREVTTSPGNGYKLEVIFSGTSVE